MRLRILLVSDNYPPFIGGAHRQTQLLAKELTARGHQLCIATVWHPGLPTQTEEEGIPVYRLKQLRTILPWLRKGEQQYQPPFPDPITVAGLHRVIKQFQPDVIHTYGWISYSLAVALWRKQIPLLVSGRDYAYSCATRTLIYRGESLCTGPAPTKCLVCASHLYGASTGWSAVLGVTLGQRLLKAKMSGVHSISTYVQEIAERDFLGQAAIHSSKQEQEREDEQDQQAQVQAREVVKTIIPSFRESDPEEWYSDDPDLQAYVERLPAEPYILFVGALRRVKGVPQLLAAYAQLKSPPPLVLIGTLEADSPHEFPPGVTVLENYPHRAVMAAWERALFGVIPSLWPEPLGSVVYEGMSRGKAMIGTKPGGHTDMIIDGQTGLLVPLGDVDALVQAMQSLIDQPAWRERLGSAARSHAQQFTAQVNVPRFEQAYRMIRQQSLGKEQGGSETALTITR